MRQLNNKHYDTIQGASARQGEVVSSASSPLVSQQKDETMNKEQKDLIIALLGLESARLTSSLMGEKNKEEIRLVKIEREFVRKTILAVRGGK